MSEQLQWSVETQDQASQALNAIQQAVDEMSQAFEQGARSSNEALDETGRSLDETGNASSQAEADASSFFDSIREGGQHVVVANQALELGTKALDAFGTAYGHVSELVTESLDAWRQQDRALQNLERAYQATGLEGRELEEQVERLTQVSSEYAELTLFGNEQVEQAIGTYQRMTPEVISAERAHRDLNTILGMSHVEQQDAAASAETYAQAMDGQDRAINQIVRSTSLQEEQLEAASSQQERARLAVSALQEQYAGAAQDVDDVALAHSRTENAVDDMRKSLGEAIAESTTWSVVLDDVSGGLEGVAEELDNSESELQAFVNISGTAADGLSQLVQDDIERVETGWRRLNRAINGVNQSLREVPEPLEGAVRPLRNLTEGWFAMQDGAITGAGAASDAADASDDAADSADDAAEAIDGIGDASQRSSQHLEMLIEQLEWLDDTYDQQQDFERREEAAQLRIEAMETQDAILASQLEKEADLLEIRADDSLIAEERQEAFLRRQNQFEEERQQIIEDRNAAAEREHREKLEAAEAAEEAAKREAQAQREALATKIEQREEEEQRNRVAGLRLRQLEAEDQLREAALEKEIQMQRLEGREDELTDAELEAEQAQIRAQHEEQVARIRRQRQQEERRRNEEMHRERMEQLRQQQDAEIEMASRVSEAFADADLGALSAITDGAIEARHTLQELQQAGASSAEALGGAIGAGGDVATRALEQTEINTRQLAGVKAAFEGAQAAAAYAAGNVPQGIAHTGAAGLYAGVAGGAIQTGSGGASGGGGQSSSMRPSDDIAQQAIDETRQREIMRDANLDAMREYDREGQQVRNEFNMQGANFFERDPTSARRANQTLRQAGQRSYSGMQATE